MEYREIKCQICGSTVELSSSWANPCDGCPAEYNGFGQMLADRRFWGEETGEHPADLSSFNPDTYDFDDNY